MRGIKALLLCALLLAAHTLVCAWADSDGGNGGQDDDTDDSNWDADDNGNCTDHDLDQDDAEITSCTSTTHLDNNTALIDGECAGSRDFPYHHQYCEKITIHCKKWWLI